MRLKIWQSRLCQQIERASVIRILILPLLLTISLGASSQLRGDGKCAGVFCNLPGGDYLNALYRGDDSALQRIEQSHRQEVLALIDQMAGRFGLPRNDVMLNVLKKASTDDPLITMVANKYLHSYQKWPEKCFREGSVELTFSYYQPSFIEVDADGMVSETDEISYDSVYRVNPEFVTLARRVGSATGSKSSSRLKAGSTLQSIYRGIEQLIREHDCSSPQIRQLESHLARLGLKATEQPRKAPVLRMFELFGEAARQEQPAAPPPSRYSNMQREAQRRAEQARLREQAEARRRQQLEKQRQEQEKRQEIAKQRAQQEQQALQRVQAYYQQMNAMERQYQQDIKAARDAEQKKRLTENYLKKRGLLFQEMQDYIRKMQGQAAR